MFGSGICVQYSSVMKWARVFLASPFHVYIYSTLFIIHFSNHTVQVEMQQTLRLSFFAKRASKKERKKDINASVRAELVRTRITQ